MPGRPRRITLRLTVGTAKRTRKCRRNGSHKIGAGEQLLLLKEPGPASGEHGYCSSCASEMINAAHKDLQEIANQLGMGTEG